jgi:hypothetical protein
MSDEREWDREIARMIACGEAQATNEFMRVGWLPPIAPDSRDADRSRD